MTLSDTPAEDRLTVAAEWQERFAALLGETGAPTLPVGDSSAIIQTWGYDSGSADNRIVVHIRRSSGA